MKIFGNLLLIFGIILGFSVITMDTSVSTGFGRVNNLGLMNQQSNLLIGAGIAFISGILLTVLTPKNQNSQNKELSSGSKKCPYCAETIKMEAVICRFCNKELPVSAIESVKTFENTDRTNSVRERSSKPSIEEKQRIFTIILFAIIIIPVVYSFLI